jgi:Putative metallopeptidase
MKPSTLLLIATCFALLPTPALSQEAVTMKPNQILIAYEPPLNPAHQAVFELLKGNRVLEKFKELLSPLRLPRPLMLKLKGCNGEANAWYDYDDMDVTVCYELIQKNIDDAPKETTPAGITREDAIIGPLAEIFLHETAHAIFDLLEVPVLGREEDAADLVAAYILLKFKKEEARKLLAGVAYMYGTQAKIMQPQIRLDKFADEHGVPAQRYFNYLCMAYGDNPELYADAVTLGGLPKGRAERCAAEYEQIDFAFKKLITPYVDPTLKKKLRNKQWLNPAKDK